MAIEFRCPQCNRILRTPDGTAGKRVKCPQCGKIDTIPSTPEARQSASPPPIGPNLPTAAKPPAGDLPLSPGADLRTPPPPIGRPGSVPAEPVSMTFGDLITETRQIYRTNFIRATAVMSALWVLICCLVVFVLPVVEGIMRQSDAGLVGFLFGYVAASVIVPTCVAVFLVTIGLTRRLRQADLFNPKALLTALAVIIIIGVVPAVIQVPLAGALEIGLPRVLRPLLPFALLIVPIGVMATVTPAICLAVDQKTGVRASVRRSIELTRGHRIQIGTVFAVIWLLCGVPAWLMAHFLTGPGALLAGGGLVWTFILPLTAFALCAAYRAMTGTSQRVEPKAAAAD